MSEITPENKLPRITSEQWQLIRLRYEAGESAQQIADSLGGHPNVKTIRNRRAVQGWQVKTIANALRVTTHLGADNLLLQRVLAEYQKIAFANIKQFGELQQNGDFVMSDLSTLRDADAAAISEITRTTQGYKIKLYDKLDALAMLAKYLGLIDARAADKLSSAEKNRQPLEIILKEIQF